MNVKQPTILTNLQRGNVKQENPILFYQRTIYELAAQGELYNIEPRMVDAIDENQMTPLMWAAGYGQNLTVEYLLRSGANPNHRDINGRTALMLAAFKGYLHVVKTLVRNGANVNDLDESKCTALMYAAHEDHSLVIQELLRNEANLGITNLHGRMAYGIALLKQSRSTQATIEAHLVTAMRGPLTSSRQWY